VGGIIVPINPKIPKNKIAILLKEINSDWLISLDPSFRIKSENNVKILGDLTIVDLHPETNTTGEINALSFSQEATIIFTSGSGGNPKGVLHTIGNHYYSALGSNENIRLNSDDCWMVSLPYFHVAGIAILFRTLISGAACYIPDGNQKVQDQLNRTRVTHLSLVSTQLYRWLEELTPSESGSSLKAILLGGSQISPTLIQQAIQKKLPVHTSYGSTEMSSQITTTSKEDLKNDLHISGKLLSYREMKIDDIGEILVRGETLCKGYISGKKLISCLDSGDWYHTGDVGFLDHNENLIIRGRLDNMFISGGENIYPEEIERQLQVHDQIVDVCVIDIKDVEYGARPVAFVKMDGDEIMNETDFKEYLKDKIAAFKIPDRFFTWPENMDSLKPDREYLRGLAIENMRSK
jgi:O-succinylbenzoic acid--CoA ligase